MRAAIAHEVADGALTVVALVAAVAIARLGWRWLDPALSLAVAAWLAAWSARRFVRRNAVGQRGVP